jgi:hypothetical protein
MTVPRRVGLVIDRLYFRLGFLNRRCVHAGLHYFDLDRNFDFDFDFDFDLERTFDFDGAFDFGCEVTSDFIFLATD